LESGALEPCRDAPKHLFRSPSNDLAPGTCLSVFRRKGRCLPRVDTHQGTIRGTIPTTNLPVGFPLQWAIRTKPLARRPTSSRITRSRIGYARSQEVSVTKLLQRLRDELVRRD
jgi:hypothetical protein